jgi:hypothetical protein
VNERDTSPDPATPLDDDAIGRLIESAGPRPPIAREDLDAIALSARAAWQARGSAERSADGAPALLDRRPTASRAGSRGAVVLALAAAIGALVFGLRAWRTSVEHGTPAAVAARRVATVAAGSGPLRVEVGGVERLIEIGGEVASGAVVRTASGSVTPVGEESARGALRLESGAEIRIDSGSAARLVSPSRIDLLAGAIYADTEADAATNATDAAGEAASALEVHTVAGTARDVGTRFMVRVSGASEAPALQVMVRAGAVMVERDGESETANRGEQIRARAGGAMARGPAEPYGAEWDWVIDAAPPFEVAGRSIAEIMDWVSRETGWTVRYEDAALAEAARRMIQEASRAQVAVALRPDQAPFVLLAGANLEGHLESGVLTIRRR